MSASFPCLNPTCVQVFTPEEIRGKASLKCPRCGTVFQFRAETPLPKPSPTPPPKNVARKPPPAPPKKKPAVPLASPVKPPPSRPVPLASPVTPPLPTVPDQNIASLPPSTPELYFEGRPTTLVSENIARRARGSWKKLAWVLPLVLILGGGAITGAILGYRWLANRGVTKQEDTPTGDYPTGVIHYVSPSPDWTSDEHALKGLGAAIARKRSKPRNHLAIHFHDYEKSLPTRAMMIDVALTRLRKYFDPVEWELKPDSPDWKVGELKGFALEFAGNDKEQVPITGEVVMTASEGIGYWFFTWGPESQRDDIAAQWPVVRSKLTILKSREGWQETPRPTDTLPLGETPYELRYVKDLWRKRDDAKDWDPAALAVLLGTDPKEGKAHAGKQASARVLLLPKVEGELKAAADAAKNYVIERQKAEYDATKPPIPEKNKAGSVVDGPRAIGEVPGYLTKWHVINDENRERYMVLWVVKLDDAVLVVQCDCDWNRRDFWEQEFMPLVESFQKKK